MAYANLAQCVADLEKNGHLKRINARLEPNQEIPAVQRRAFARKSPALLFTNAINCRFPLLANLFGTRERVNFIFRESLDKIKDIFEIVAKPKSCFDNPLKLLKLPGLLPHILHMRSKSSSVPETRSFPPVLANRCTLADLPGIVSWPLDGGPFITLPLVYSQGESANLGMYRVQLSGNDYLPDEVGMHYQLQRGIGIHHAMALEEGRDLPVHIYVGGPPALTFAAVMPLPEGMDELMFAGLLGGRSMRLEPWPGFDLPLLAECDFLLNGKITRTIKPEGPFGDHMGYYSLKHDFPVVKIESVWHRSGAIWPFTTVGRPPQEDTVFGDLIHELTAPMLGQVFKGVEEVHAVDAAGVHPLLLAIGNERYTPYEERRKPRELLTLAMHLLGNTQTALAKYLFIIAREDNPALTARDVAAFFEHLLERTDFENDLHFFTRSCCDTLDYTGTNLNEGSKLVWAAAGPKRRGLSKTISGLERLPAGFTDPRIVAPGIMVISGPAHKMKRGQVDTFIENEFCEALAHWSQAEKMPLVAIVEDANFSSANWSNFLWTVFTRSDPATDIYGARSSTNAKHWQCKPPLVIDARRKDFHAPELEEDKAVKDKIERLGMAGGPLAGII